jgi:hypothetical protein
VKIAASTALVLAVVLTGCSNKAGPSSNDERPAALSCMTKKHKLDAKLVGKDSIQVGNPGTGPLIKFFLTRGQAEAAQFQGTAEGTIQSGAALIFVRRNGDKLLSQVEDCIDSL